jgi:hypothetical protein
MKIGGWRADLRGTRFLIFIGIVLVLATATGVELMAMDYMTNDVIAVAQDDKSAGFTERFSKWGSTEDAFKFWGERIKLFLDQAHGLKQ